MGIEVHRLGPQIGAEIRGVDVRRLDDAGFATIYRALGIEHDNQVRDPIGRPFRIAGMNGRPLAPLFGAAPAAPATPANG